MQTHTETNDEADHAELVAAIHTRRVIMCKRVEERHVEGGCPSCGL